MNDWSILILIQKSCKKICFECSWWTTTNLILHMNFTSMQNLTTLIWWDYSFIQLIWFSHWTSKCFNHSSIIIRRQLTSQYDWTMRISLNWIFWSHFSIFESKHLNSKTFDQNEKNRAYIIQFWDNVEQNSNSQFRSRLRQTISLSIHLLFSHIITLLSALHLENVKSNDRAESENHSTVEKRLVY